MNDVNEPNKTEDTQGNCDGDDLEQPADHFVSENSDNDYHTIKATKLVLD